MKKQNLRHPKILALLKEFEVLSISDLQDALQISLPSVYRDTRALVHAGLAERVTGGIMLAKNQPTYFPPKECGYCHTRTTSRTKATIQVDDQFQIPACCPHCALLILEKFPHTSYAMVTDFLYGSMVNIRQASFLLESRVTLCCSPSVLAFTRIRDALRFQLGFGGDILSFEQAQSGLKKLMDLHPPHNA